jgi:hypothetical protein
MSDGRENESSRVEAHGVFELPGGTGDDRQRPLQVVSTPLFGRMWAPETLDEYFSVVASHSLDLQDPSGWRGQTNIKWPLHSTAFRRMNANPEAADLGGVPKRTGDFIEDRLSEYEARLLDLVRDAGHGYRDGRRLSDLELLALLQHHGAATRLVDWTTNALTALWFACRSDVTTHGAVFGVQLDHAWRITSEERRTESFSKLLDAAHERMTYFQPPPLSPRILAQGGFFLWSQVQHRDWSSLGTLAAEPADDDDAVSVMSEEFMAIAIAPELKRYMKERWRDLFGYAEHTLFPDFDGFANAHGAQSELPWDFFVEPR